MYALPATAIGHIWNAHSPALARFVEANIGRFDLLHVHELWHYPSYVAVRTARRHGIPYLISIHGELGERAIRRKGLRKWLYMKVVQGRMLRSATALHALTEFEAAEAGRLGVSTKIALVPNGVSTDFLQGIERIDTADFLKRHPQLAGKRVILFLGRVAQTKGLDVLARSFIETAKRFADAVLLVVGPDRGDTQRKIVRLLASAGLSDRVTFTGVLVGADKLAAFACADVFVLPSRMEGFSNAVLEALGRRTAGRHL